MRKMMFKYWVPLAITVTGLFFFIYAAVQQDIRQAANDPQIQMAEDSAIKLADGQPVQQIVPAEKVDIAKSLAPYIIVFDTTGKPLVSSAQLDGQTPTIPSGVFDAVRQGSEDRITWQPASGVRSAVVVTQVKGPHPGFVMAGRSLREVEIRESDIKQVLLFGWIGMLLVTLLATVVITIIARKPTNR